MVRPVLSVWFNRWQFNCTVNVFFRKKVYIDYDDDDDDYDNDDNYDNDDDIMLCGCQTFRTVTFSYPGVSYPRGL